MSSSLYLEDPEVVGLHTKIDQLALLEPAAIFSLHLLTQRVLEAARERAARQWADGQVNHGGRRGDDDAA